LNKELFDALDLLEKERGIQKEYMIERIEAALVSAYKRDSGNACPVRVKTDTKAKEIKMYKQLTVVETVTNPKSEISLEEANRTSVTYSVGDIFEVEVAPRDFGRISAQTAKQVIIQGIREAERGMMIKEYEEKKEEIVQALVLRVDPVTGNATVEIGKNEMMLYKNEQINGETLQAGDRIKVFIIEVKRENRGPSIVLSRTHPGLVRRLFEMEVPEIKDGIVEIKNIAREPGSRTKIAVSSNDPDVDPVGACIGPKSIRKNNVSLELPNEKIDIIKYSDIPEEFISSALAPASVVSVTKVSDSEKMYRVIVNEDQLSLAIGREGQNARLAAKLTGCKVDIKSVKTAEAESVE